MCATCLVCILSLTKMTPVFNVWFTRSLASRLAVDTPLTVDVVNPGLCHSELTRDLGRVLQLVFRFLKLLLARSTEVESRTLIHAALGGTQAEVQGLWLNA